LPHIPIACLRLGVLALTASVFLSPPSHAADNTIKIGVLVDMNGPLSTASGRGSLEAARMAAEEFGWSVNGKRIEIISADHQNKPDIGAAIARQWYNVDQVDVIVDLSNSSVGFAVVEVARPLNKIVLLSGPGSSDFTGKACAPTSIHWTWDTYAAATGAVQGTIGPDTKTWFFIGSDYAFGRALERDAANAVERLGGKVLGNVWAPFNNADFSSFLLQAQQSGAAVIGFATGGQDTINVVKQAAEFGLAKPNKSVTPMQLMIDEIKAIGLPLGQGNFATMAFHHDRSPEAKAWAQRFNERVNFMPSQIQAGVYSAVAHYLRAIRETGSVDPLTVVAKMKTTPINDIFATNGYIRDDGRMVHDVYFVQIKSPGDSNGPWDLVKIIKTIPGDQAFRPLSESECPLVKKKS
jgi:branched-chain amino acid transport system substrate-binding protein